MFILANGGKLVSRVIKGELSNSFAVKTAHNTDRLCGADIPNNDLGLLSCLTRCDEVPVRVYGEAASRRNVSKRRC